MSDVDPPDESEGETRIIPSAPCPKSDSCEDVHDELRAHSDAMKVLVYLCDKVEESADEDADAMSLALPCKVHSEVNTIKEILAKPSHTVMLVHDKPWSRTVQMSSKGMHVTLNLPAAGSPHRSWRRARIEVKEAPSVLPHPTFQMVPDSLSARLANVRVPQDATR